MFSMNREKALGYDGFAAQFFKIGWFIVGKESVNVILYFFSTSDILPVFNSTIIALVPKCENPNNVRDYRLISCYFFVYKCITKILANRLKKFLHVVIRNNQSDFIKRRSITDNILMAKELVRGYGISFLSPSCAVKIDLQKAFDSLD